MILAETYPDHPIPALYFGIAYLACTVLVLFGSLIAILSNLISRKSPADQKRLLNNISKLAIVALISLGLTIGVSGKGFFGSPDNVFESLAWTVTPDLVPLLCVRIALRRIRHRAKAKANVELIPMEPN